MNIGLLIGQIERIGGMEKQAVILARELAGRGHEVSLFVAGPRTSRSAPGLATPDAVAVRHLYHTRYSRRFCGWLLRRRCARGAILDLVAFNVENAEIAVAAGIGARIVMSVRGTRFSRDPAFAERYRSVAPRCALLVTNSENTRELLERSDIAPRKSVFVVHNGIELPEAAPSRKGKMILYVGSIKEVKDPMTFLEACREVVELDDDVRVTMVGDGGMRGAVESYIRARGLGGKIALTGETPYEKIPYGEASVFVNSSVRESSSNSLLEALSFGIPVVATANSGNSDILGRLERGRLVPVADSGAMARAIRDLLGAGPEERRAIFEESRALVREHYSVPKMVDGYVELLSKR